MEKIVSEGFGCKIIERDSKFYIQYDSGQAASCLVESEITVEEAKKAMISSQDAYQVIIDAQERGGAKRAY